MSYSIHVITTPTVDTPGTTFLLRTQKRNYVFGSVAEGTQRAMVEMSTRLTKVQDFFLTGRMDWANMGGLLGLTLTLADSASSSYQTSLDTWKMSKGQKKAAEPQPPRLNMYGPPNLNHKLSTARRFIFRKGIPTTATEFRDVSLPRDTNGRIQPSWQDDYIDVWALPLSPSSAKLDAEEEAMLLAQYNNYDTNLNTFEEFQAPENESRQDQELRYGRIRQAVVDYMFNSTWNFDTLVEQHISEVAFPATLFVRNPNTHHIEPYRGPMPGGKEPVPDIKVLTRTPWPGAKVLALPPTRPAPESISYIVRAKKFRGTFDAKRAKELGIKPGPLFGRLSNGESITNDKGEIITPEMVLGPDKPGQGFAILDVPSIDYLDRLVEREELQSDDIMDGVQVCFWLLGPGVSGHPTLQQMMKKLNRLEHIISSVDTCPNNLTFESVAEQTGRLCKIDPARYNIPYSDDQSLPQHSLAGMQAAGKSKMPEGVKAARKGLAYDIMPAFKMRETPPSVASSFNDRVMARMDADVLQSAEEARQAVQNDAQALATWRSLLARPDTEVITLGTGSALPSKYRNVSATLLRVPGVGNYLFDCGENTLGQLQRMFDHEELKSLIKDLRMIWISHLHADHHLGTVSVIKAWYQLKHNSVPVSRQPVISNIAEEVSDYGLSIVSHDGMIKWLWEYSSVEDFGYSRILPFTIQPGKTEESDSTSRLFIQSPDRKGKYTGVLGQEDYEKVMGLADIQSCYVRHCNGAMAVSLTFPRSQSDPEELKPLKVSYSGDCRPSQNFAQIGRHSTVLIHEATFDDELLGDAKAKKHSTTSEALGIGAQMDAKAVVLTHFSQRYQKIPILETVQDDEQVGTQSADLMEGVQEEDDEAEDDGPADNMDAHSSAATVTAPPNGAVSSEKPRAKDEGHEQVVKVRSKDMKVAVAFDYMRVKIGEIAQLEKFNDALTKLLTKEEEVDDHDDDAEQPTINANGKKASGDEGHGAKKNKKSKRNK
ncbi:unnamed protein product [Periconia digitata]|uniref:ribonuclease Z n=1 Tax=Periconia digitata TaxID=1303443 RepID=A0A9W4UIC2_9PLEO|nr:unnamed protein product [Periconia digitata]